MGVLRLSSVYLAMSSTLEGVAAVHVVPSAPHTNPQTLQASRCSQARCVEISTLSTSLGQKFPAGDPEIPSFNHPPQVPEPPCREPEAMPQRSIDEPLA